MARRCPNRAPPSSIMPSTCRANTCARRCMRPNHIGRRRRTTREIRKRHAKDAPHESSRDKRLRSWFSSVTIAIRPADRSSAACPSGTLARRDRSSPGPSFRMAILHVITLPDFKDDSSFARQPASSVASLGAAVLPPHDKPRSGHCAILRKQPIPSTKLCICAHPPSSQLDGARRAAQACDPSVSASCAPARCPAARSFAIHAAWSRARKV